MKIHARPEHVRIDDKYFFARWTRNFYSLTHHYLAIILILKNSINRKEHIEHIFFLCVLWVLCGKILLFSWLSRLRPIGGTVRRNMLQHFARHIVFQLDARHRFIRAFGDRRKRPDQVAESHRQSYRKF